MKPVRQAAPQLAAIEPYDPKYIPADIMISANENSLDVPFDLRREVEREIRKVALNRYPDPLANDLRDMIAQANGLDRDQVILGNGGDELLFNTALAWGGPGRTYLDLPPTFSVYRNNAQLTNTQIVEIDRLPDYSIDEEALIARLSADDVDFTILTSPNNPTGNLVHEDLVERVLNATDALVMVDEAYFEFSRNTVRPLLERYENLVILRTFSKAFSMAGVRLGYLLGNPAVIDQYKKVRQPYSVDAVSQAIGRVVYANRAVFEKGIDAIIEQRDVVLKGLGNMEGVKAYPSEANYILFKADDSLNASEIWQALLDAGILIRDLSHSRGLENCLRVSIGTAEENAKFLAALAAILEHKGC